MRSTMSVGRNDVKEFCNYLISGKFDSTTDMKHLKSFSQCPYASINQRKIIKAFIKVNFSGR